MIKVKDCRYSYRFFPRVRIPASPPSARSPSVAGSNVLGAGTGKVLVPKL